MNSNDNPESSFLSPCSITGAIAGDIIGSAYESGNTADTGFELFPRGCRFTDDTVLTIAVADALMNNRGIGPAIHDYGNRYPGRGYGRLFSRWLKTKDPEPYYSCGNGSAMRVSPVGFAFNTLSEVLRHAKASAEVTHNHPEGIKGAQAVAACIFLARKAESKDEIYSYINDNFDYDLNFSLDEIRGLYSFDETCQGSVPQAIRAFLESTDYENAVRLAVSIGGDSDTIACITGGIACAFYRKIPKYIADQVYRMLPDEFTAIIRDFDNFIKNQ